jgi:uncharacterized Zn-binding protein involved in type VI secretion
MKLKNIIITIILLLFLSSCTFKPQGMTWQDFAIQSGNPTKCKSASLPDTCILGYTQATGDGSSCSKIEDPSLRKTCIAYDKGASPENILEDEYGITEKNGVVYINSKPGEVLSIKSSDLPQWARGKIATVGATITVTGPPDSVIEGDENVLLDGLPVARVGDATAQGGTIVDGSNNIIINGKQAAVIGSQTTNPMISGAGVPHVGGPIVSNPNELS